MISKIILRQYVNHYCPILEETVWLTINPIRPTETVWSVPCAHCIRANVAGQKVLFKVIWVDSRESSPCVKEFDTYSEATKFESALFKICNDSIDKAETRLRSVTAAVVFKQNGLNITETSVMLELQEKGFEVYRTGWPDFLAHRNGKIIAVEVKSKTDKLRKEQAAVHRLLASAGVKVYVVYPECETMEMVLERPECP